MVLACFLTVEGRSSRELLADMFWGDRPGPLAFRNLRNALYQLRCVFPDRAVLADRHWVDLDLGDVDVDLKKLDELESVSDLELKELSRPFMESVSLPQCPRFERWLESMRRNVSQRYREGTRQRVRSLMACGDHRNALSVLDFVIDLDDLNEELYQRRFLCLSALGLKSRIVESYRYLERKLDDELGLAPSQETQETYRAAISLNVCSSPEKRQNNGGSSLVPFFGRGRELEQIRIFLQRNCDGPRCVYVSGEAGVGKSRLVAKAVESLRFEGPVIIGRALRDATHPLLPWDGIMESLAQQVDLEDLDLPVSVLCLLGEVFPSLKIQCMASQHVPLARIGALVALVLDRFGAGRRVSLVIEDLQWLDEGSWKVMEGVLLHSPSNVDFFFTTRSYGSPFSVRFFRDVEKNGSVSLFDLNLKCFSREETREFCRAALLGRSPSLEALDRIYAQTEGLPLFLVESIRLLASGRSVDEIPVRLSEALEVHLMDLADDGLSLIEWLSAFSVPADLGILQQVSELPMRRLVDLVEELVAQSIVLERNVGGRSCLDFSHGTLKEYVYRRMSHARRQLIHGSLATILKADLAGRFWNDLACSRVIHHCHRAGEPLDELEYTLMRLRRHITLNYELFPLLNDDVLRRSSSSFETMEQTIELLNGAKSLIRSLKNGPCSDIDRLRRMEVLFLALSGGYRLWWGEYDPGKVLVRSALDQATTMGEWELALESLQHLCYYGIQIEDSRFLSAYAKRLSGVAGRCGNAPAKAMAFRFLGMSRMFAREYDLAERLLRSSIERFETIEALDAPYTLQIIAANSYLGDIAHRTGRLSDALNIYEACIDACEAEGFFRGLCLFRSNAAHVALDLNEGDVMDHHLRAAHSFLERRRGNSILFSLSALRAWQEGDRDRCRWMLEQGDRLCVPLHKRFWLALHLWVKGVIAAQSGVERAGDMGLSRSAREYLEDSLALYRDMEIDHKVQLLRRLI